MSNETGNAVSTVADKILLLKNDFDAVYEAGGKDAYEAGYAKAESVNPFYYATRLDNVCGGQVFPENYEAVVKLKKAPKYCGYIFNNSLNLKSVKFISEDQTNTVDFSSTLSISAANRQKATLEIADLTEFNKKFSNIYISFGNQINLKSILGALDLSVCTNVTNAFNYCSALEEIEFVPNTIPISINFSSCSKLTNDSKASIFNGLYNYGDKTYDITDNPFRIISAMEMPMQYIIMSVGENEDGYEIFAVAAADGNTYSFFAPKRNNYSQEIINALKEGTYFNIDCEIVNGDWQVNSWTITALGSYVTQTLTLPSSLKILQSQVDYANAKGWTVAGGTVVSEEEYYG